MNHRGVRVHCSERWAVGLASLLGSGFALADDVTGADPLLCYGFSASRCEADAQCEVTEPWRLNLPDFVKLELREKRAATTSASGEQRETEIQTVRRENGTILLQGTQGERAFSWLITEATGEGTMTVAAPGLGVTVFTVCTAIEKL